MRRAQGLGVDDDVEPWIDRLVGEDRDLMLVGFSGFLERLASALLTGSATNPVVAIEEGGIVCLETLGDAWKLRWSIRPEMA